VKPSVGRIVHLNDGPDKQHKAAIIAYVYSDTCVNLSVFEPHNVNAPIALRTSVLFNETGAAGTWHWPEREA
jgi:hypothetical protein